MKNGLDTVWDTTWDAMEKLNAMSSEDKEKIGDKAFEYISDYPLYASTSGISYDEAIMIALVIGKDEFLESLSVEE